jgi:hypothetical protein
MRGLTFRRGVVFCGKLTERYESITIGSGGGSELDARGVRDRIV